MERTLVLLKPDSVQRGIMGKILSRFEEKGFLVVGAKLKAYPEATWTEHYAHIAGKPFFPGILKFMTSGPVLALALEGQNVVEEVRKMCGATHPKDAAMGTIRGDFAKTVDYNVIHASDSAAAAETELKRFFAEGEVLETYSRALASL